MKECFIVCPIGEEGTSQRKRSDQLLKYVITPVCEQKGYKIKRSDLIPGVDKINQTIIDCLVNADLVIADLSDHNPNAFFELGYRTALNKPLIHVIEEGQSIPFDVGNIRTIFYDLTDLDKTEKTKERLTETIDAIGIIENNEVIESDNVKNSGNGSDNLTQQQQYLNWIINGILSIKDDLSELKEIAVNGNNAVLEQIVSIFTNQMRNMSNPQDKAVEIFLKELFKNPQKAMKIFNQFAKVDSQQSP